MSSKSSNAGNLNDTVILDSLPYIESVHEDYEEYALSLIEEEMKSITPRPLKKIPPLKFRTSVMKTEFDGLQMLEDESTGEVRIVNSLRSSQDSHGFQPLKIVRPTNLEEWTTHALPQIKTRLEAERLRGLALEVEKEEAVQCWKDYNASLDALKAYWTRSLQDRNEAVEEINFQRQQAQTQNLGPEIDRLTQEYQHALYRRNQLEHAIEAIKRKGDIPSADDIDH
ncbi:Pre-mRNA-splicing factor SPF27 [Nitzschia inconspicua]|uniref:Pre-mRNA-splicing factor SPF27 n=1 Tax=Nitzschia inconspicua TaxID=303405 RepID=A0A9K3KPT2_9STRA|nr:Pre-mRNA-splicing factor SPF27 [Nitzschia inconspicua]